MNKTWWWLSAFIIVGVLLGAGIIFLVTRPPRGEPIILLPAPSQSPFTVYVNGAVKKPGLFAVPPGSRVNDVIQAAGGTTDDANIDTLNLARIIEDGEQITVPERINSTLDSNETEVSDPSLLMVNINTASLEQLDTLPGIGPITGQNIIDYRTANGPFTTIEQLLDVPNIGQITFDKVKDFISIGTPP
jgi:competence protein ComEA